jgi:Trm5-related predicted tRNA methylase
MTTQKINEDLIKMILENEPLEKAIVKIAQAMTNRDEIIKKLRKM